MKAMLEECAVHAVRLVAYVVMLAAAICVFSATAFSAEPDPWGPLRGVVEIQVSQGRMASWTGSGTLVAKRDGMGLILSCRHVNTRVGMPVEIVWHGWGIERTTGRPPRVKGYVAYVMQDTGESQWHTDLAMVLAPAPDAIQPTPAVRFDPANGPWISAGYRGGKFFIAKATTAQQSGHSIVTNSPFVGGMSGGATLDKYGRLVAVVVASDRFTTGISADGDNLHYMLGLFGKRSAMRGSCFPAWYNGGSDGEIAPRLIHERKVTE